MITAGRALLREVAGLKARRVYGGRFVTALHPEDDLLHYTAEHANAAHSTWRHYHGFDWYFRGGLANVRTVEDVLTYGGSPLAGARSVLEFASGYGRLTRHLVPRIDRSRLTVADVDRQAVDFVRSTFGVDGFYSTSDPAELVRPERYDLILVVSLFSHLPARTWNAWLRTLLDLLEPGGALLFTTLPLDTLGQEPAPEDREGVERGFSAQVAQRDQGAAEHRGVRHHERQRRLRARGSSARRRRAHPPLPASAQRHPGRLPGARVPGRPRRRTLTATSRSRLRHTRRRCRPPSSSTARCSGGTGTRARSRRSRRRCSVGVRASSSSSPRPCVRAWPSCTGRWPAALPRPATGAGTAPRSSP
jgi:SAM-dependent methyltransferase